MKKLFILLLAIFLTISLSGQDLFTSIISSQRTASGSSAPATIQTSLISWYDIHEESGTIVDTESAHNSTATNGTYSTDGFACDAVDEFITLPDHADWAVTRAGDFTVSAFIYLTDVSTAAAKNIMGTYNGWAFYLGDDTPPDYQMRWYIGGVATEGTTVTWTASTWYSVIMVKDAEVITFYRNNIAAGSANEDAYTSINPSTMFIGGDTGNEFLGGRIKKVGVWGKAISSAERSWLASGGTPYE